MNKVSNCIFCTIPEDRVFYKNKYVKALFSLWPITDYHFLTIPTRHIADEKNLTQKEVTELYKVRIKITNAIDELVGYKDYNLLLNQGEVAGRTIDHIHYHTAFRKKDDLKKSPLANILIAALQNDDVDGLRQCINLAYEISTDLVGGVRNIIPGMGNYKKNNHMIPKREKDVLKWTKQIKGCLS